MISGIVLSVIAALACFVSAFYLYDDGGSFAAVLLLVAIVVFLIVLLVGMMKQYADVYKRQVSMTMELRSVCLERTEVIWRVIPYL